MNLDFIINVMMDGTDSYGTIETSESDGETFVFIPDKNTNEIFPEDLNQITNLVNLLNAHKEVFRK
jgi:hypothetical protein